MKRFLIFAFLMPFILLANAYTDTEVSGHISTNTTWTKANSPYIITGMVLVEQGVTLTIKPGVVARFDSTAFIWVNGEIIAIGTETDSIRFTANTDNPSTVYWGGIYLTDTAVPTTVNNDTIYVSGSTFQYCIFEYSGVRNGADYEGALSTEVNLFISNCRFTNNRDSNGGGAINAKYALIINSIFYNNRSHYGGAIYCYTAIIINCLFNNNNGSQGGAIWTNRSKIINCDFNNNVSSLGGAIYGDHLTINSCSFYDNRAKYTLASVHSRGGAIYGSYSNIKDCTFENNSADENGGAIYGSYLNISNCTFNRNCTKYGDGGTIYGDKSNITNCKFRNNSTKHNGGAIYSAYKIINCIFTNNSAGDKGGAVSWASKIINCTFSSNKAKNGGAAIYGGSKITCITNHLC